MPKKVKVFYNGKRLRDIYPHATKMQVFKWKCRKFFRKLMIWIGIALVGFIIYQIGVFTSPKVIYTRQEVIKEVQAFPPILKKIAQAESHNNHYCTQELANSKLCKQGAVGQVLVNSTLDVGKYAININYNGKWCADKGFNIFDEKQNEQCAMALFLERGSEPWNASKHNWSK